MDTVVVTDAATGKVIIFNINLDNGDIEDQIYAAIEERYDMKNTGSIDFFVASEIKMEIDLC